MTNIPKNFCVLPFVHSVYNPYHDPEKSNISICCRIDQQFNDFSGIENPIQNSEKWKKIQNQFLAGEYPVECSRCLNEEKDGVHSYRLSMNETFKEKISTEEIFEKKLLFLEIVPSNVCNLACKMCSSMYSSKRHRFDIFLNEHGFENQLEAKFPDWRKLDLSNLEILKLMGGEPTYLNEHLELLEHLSNIGRLKNISLQMPTNITTTLSDRFRKLFLECANLYLTVSIDGIGVLNEYIRQYSNWNNTHKNLIDLVEFIKSEQKFSMGVNTVITVLNVNKSKEIENFIKNTTGIDGREDITGHPDYLNIQNLPIEMRNELLLSNNISDRVRNFLNRISTVEADDYIFRKMLKFISLSDKFYNNDFKEANSEMYELLKKYDNYGDLV